MANERERLERLLEESNENRGIWGKTKTGGQWGKGNIPVHYKRINIDYDEQKRLAQKGLVELLTCFNAKVYFTQSMIAGAMLSGDYDKIGVISPSQYGKLIADDVPVLTRKGWKTHGSLVVGDEVISPDGGFARVLYVHPKGHADREVLFANGERIKCHHVHEWYVYDKSRKQYRTLETDSLVPRRHSVTRVCVEGEEKDLAVHPYVLGVWLGDGSTTKGQIHSSAEDIDVLNKVREFYPEGREWVHKDTGVITRSFIGLANDLSAYNMCYQEHPEKGKWIPDDYLTASKEQRLQLLAGLIDTDGYRYKGDGRFYYSTTNEAIKDGVVSLVSSFGWGVSVVRVPAQTSTSGVVGRNDVYQIGFNPSFDIPCVLERKRPSRFSEHRRVGIVSVQEIEPVQGNCITVEGGLYCVGRRLIPTHNSWLTGMIALLMAYRGSRVNVAAASGEKTEIIMQYAQKAASVAEWEIKQALTGETLKKVDRLDASLSKTRLSFAEGGHVTGITLGDTFTDMSHNKAIGRGGVYIVDETALVSETAMAEIGRREFSSTEKEPLLMLSNPHKPGYFYDFMISETRPRELVIWMDALTAVQEGRWDTERVLTAEWAFEPEPLQKYFLCELPSSNGGMFGDAVVTDDIPDGIRVMGIDAAYKGKDKIEVSVGVLADKFYLESIESISKGSEWIDGVTPREIIEQISRLYHMLNCEMCCVDIGFGVWLVEGLLYHGVNARGVNFGSGATKERVKARHYSAVNAANKRAEMHLDLQDMMDNQAIAFSEQAYKRLKGILPFINYEIKSNGKKLIMPKSELKAMIGHSPDALDAALLCLHCAVLYSEGHVAYMAS